MMCYYWGCSTTYPSNDVAVLLVHLSLPALGLVVAQHLDNRLHHNHLSEEDELHDGEDGRGGPQMPAVLPQEREEGHVGHLVLLRDLRAVLHVLLVAHHGSNGLDK